MSTTYTTLKTLSNEYRGMKDDQSLINNYMNCETQGTTIAYIFCKNYGLFTKKVGKFTTVLNQDDIDSAILSGICSAINSFDITRGNKLIPYVTNVIYSEVRTTAQQVRKGDAVYFIPSTRFEQETEGHDGEANIMEIDNEVAVACSCVDDHESFELQSLIQSLNLSDAQKNYLTIIINDPSLKDSEVARLLGVGRSSIANMKKRIREKLSAVALN